MPSPAPDHPTAHPDLARAFLDRFCAGDIAALTPLLAEDVHIEGPLFQGRTRAAYLAALSDDPPTPTPYHLVSLTTNDEEVAVFYRYDKPGTPLLIAQRFRLHHGRIQEMQVVFDTGVLRR